MLADESLVLAWMDQKPQNVGCVRWAEVGAKRAGGRERGDDAARAGVQLLLAVTPERPQLRVGRGGLFENGVKGAPIAGRYWP